MRRILICFFILFSLTACTTTETYAPVLDATQIEAVPKSGIYHVAANDTLYSIAWRYGLDYRDLAQRNHIARPYHIEIGETIYLSVTAPSRKTSTTLPRKETTSLTTKPASSAPILEKEPSANVSHWYRPAKGPIIRFYSNQNKGLNFGGHLSDPIFASAAGKVVYAGNGLRGYGNLIIIKHNSTFLSAYAYNHILLVKEGDWVKTGQPIAEMGSIGTQRVMLHFEIRRNGKPVNPLLYLE